MITWHETIINEYFFRKVSDGTKHTVDGLVRDSIVVTKVNKYYVLYNCDIFYILSRLLFFTNIINIIVSGVVVCSYFWRGVGGSGVFLY